METPVDILTYLPLVSALFVAMKCYITQHRQTKAFLYDVALGYFEQEVDSGYRFCLFFPACRFFTSRQRKIPARERSHVSDEEGSRLLVCSFINETNKEAVDAYEEKMDFLFARDRGIVEWLQPQCADYGA
ncbi:hypothetical protein [Thermaerobacillus caldiproteolyticus]|uniref:hypothetical protein n=1 Tax=Thermaerobacillus caldiproteolyticus TaxID=247480 RepID=UPI0018F276E9|nr:hypothetical protein [Anoxybacillus caldiproteolyticus]